MPARRSSIDDSEILDLPPASGRQTLMEEPPGLRSLVELARARAREKPHERAYTFLAEDGDTSLTYGELDRRARAVAVALQRRHAQGECALLLYPPGLELIVAFFGCLYAGMAAVLASPPRPRRDPIRLRSMVRDAGPRVVLTTEAMRSRLGRFLPRRLPDLEAVPWLATDALAKETAERWQSPSLTGGSVAFLQYTSGSTDDPKGVMVSHGNLLHNEEMLRRAFGLSEDSVVVGWLPMYHDMGLIGNVLQPVFLGARCFLMSPMSFLRKPIRWLEAISRHRATVSGGPDFAYGLCLRKVTAAERRSLDLSSWSVAFNGAEPVRAETLERFADAFAACGFRKRAFYPCYGLAEATLFVTGGSPGAPPVVETFESAALEHDRVAGAGGEGPGRRLVGCGRPWMEQRAVIVDPESGRPCPPDRIGEIWVSGPSVAQGYWNRPQATEDVFGARLDGDPGAGTPAAGAPAAGAPAGPFLRTGDLGFFRDGELFVAGRLKDLIIIRGRNHHPQDIERTAERSHPALRPLGGAAFAVDRDDEEQLVVIHELERRREADAAEAADALRRAVAEAHEVQVFDVVLVRAGTVPKTTSGKVQRFLCRARYLAGELATIAASTVAEPAAGPAGAEPSVDRRSLLALEPPRRRQVLEDHLRGLIGRAARVDPGRLEPGQPLTLVGLDSLTSIELLHACEAGLGASLSLARLLDGMSLAQLRDAILAQLEEAPREAAPRRLRRDPGGPPASPGPPSWGQRALWLADRLAPESAAYNLAAVARVRSSLDAAALRRAFEALADRHDALRSTFPTVDGEPLLAVRKGSEVDFLEIDAAAWSERALQDRLEEQAYRPFDLERGPVFRVRVLTRSPEERLVLLAVHHLAADFWSLSVLARELGALYGQASGGAPARLEPLDLRYEDYVRWQRELISGAEGERLWSYWRRRLAGDLPRLDLPADRPRPPVQSFRGASRTLRLDEEVTARLAAFGSREGATPFMILLAVFQALLSRYTGQKDVVVGTPSAGRDAAVLAPMVGYFVNPLVLRTDVSGDPSFEDLLARVRRDVLGAFEHQAFPFACLAERLQPERDASRSPLFQVMFVLQQAPLAGLEGLAAFALGEGGAHLELGGLGLESAPFETRRTQFDLTLMMAEVGSSFVAALQYDADLFDGATMRRLLEHFETLLREATAAPARRLSGLPLANAAERFQLVSEWNAAPLPRTRDVCLHELFEAQVERTPEAVAVVGPREGEPAIEDRLSYRELNRQAGRLAGELRALGVGPEVRVGLLLERSTAMVIGLLAALKAGGAYVPLDPAYPRERIDFMLRDSGARVLLTRRRLAEGLRLEATGSEPAGGPRVHFLDSPRQAAAAPESLARAAGARNLAYVLYTSGSTGLPKGVAIEHRSVVAMLDWARETYSDGELEGMLACTSICFDLSVFEIFAGLSWGGSVILAANALDLATLPAAGRVRLVNTVPSALAELLRLGGIPASARTVNLAGEPLRRELVQEIYRSERVEKVFNLYGPSEDTTYSTAALVARRDAAEPSIGRPLLGTRAYVQDRRMQPLPIGLPGELQLAGAGQARGYLGRAGRTAERFVPDPFAADGGEPGGRLYRTGDLARFRPDGELEFLGRMDHQVKVRGFRIELGEIEVALSEHPAVREAVVTARADASGDRRLVAYVVLARGGPAAIGELRSRLGERLPGFMVPGAFVELPALPRLPNGKVDRGALPAPDASMVRSATFVAPRSVEEELLAGVWCDLLGTARAGVHDHFFEQGGHSLLAARLVSRVREVFEVELALRQVFETPTLAGLAAAVAAARRHRQAAPAPAVTAVARSGAEPLSFAQERLWFLEQMEPGAPTYHIPATVRCEGRLDLPALRRSLSSVVRRHEVLRTTFVAPRGRPVQVIAEASEVPLPVVDLRRLDRGRTESRRWIAEAVRRPFDLERGPLLRVTAFRLGEEEHLLQVTLHHIVADGWSLGILVREMAAFYEPDRGGIASLPELAVQYADYAHWQRRWLRGEVLESQLAYWRGRLADLPAVLELPTDRPRPARRTFRGARRLLRFSRESTLALRELSRGRRATLFMTLLSAFQALLHRYTGQREVAVGTAVANRTRGEIEGLVGFFVNTLVLRADVDTSKSFTDLLWQVREVALEAYENQDVPFEKLVEELQPQRNLSHSPLFQVMFVLQSSPVEAPALRGSRSCEILPDDAGASKFDLALILEEAEDGLSGWLDYATDLLDGTTVARLSGHFETLVRDVIEKPEAALSVLPWLPRGERHQLVTEWNDTGAPTGPGTSVAERFEAQAERTPEAVAIVFARPGAPEQGLSFRELDRRADRLAHRLRGLGVAPEVRVGICLERSPEMLVALLGILKAGGAYVPLNPVDAPRRLSRMVKDAGLALLLTRSGAAGNLPEVEVPVLRWDEELRDLADDGRGKPVPRAGPENLAYVLYTSGSTGRPKGVMIRHVSLLNLLRGLRRSGAAGAAERVGLNAPLAFDASVKQILQLLAGSTLVVVPEEVRQDPQAFRSFLERGRLEQLDCTPQQLKLLLEAGLDPAAAPRLLVGGEEMAAATWKALAASGRHFNVYGPTETTVDVSVRRVREAAVPAIGRPLANLRIWVVDPRLRPVPMGVAGELGVGGLGLGRGYFGAPRLTAEKFVPEPFSGERGSRLYKTGDLVRYLPDGHPAFLSRRDHQVKLRGFRIELGEIASVLEEHPGVRRAAVVLWDDAGPGEPPSERLVAYVVPGSGEAGLGGTLAGFLRRRLPAYMVPAGFVELASLPLTRHDKLDRGALSAPPSARLEPAAELAPPRTPVEELLAGLWCEVLGVDRVGVFESFFELGGHSLLATRLMSRIRRIFALDLPLREIFEAPTIAGLAAAIEAARREGRGLEAPPLEPVSRARDLPLSFAQERLWFLAQLAPDNPRYNVAAALRLSGPFEPRRLHRCLEEIVRRHEALRTRFPAVEGRPLQVIVPEPEVALPRVDLQALAGPHRREESERLRAAEARRPFDLERGPLLRVTLLASGGGEHEVLVAMHHIVSDGWSVEVLVRELAALYRAFGKGGAPPLPALPVQYADYAVWQRDWLRDLTLERQLGYWKGRLAGAPSTLELPADRPRPPLQGSRGALRPVGLEARLGDELRSLGRRLGATLYMTLLAAFETLLLRLTGQDDLVVGTPVANRDRAEIEGLIGFFVNTLALRGDLSEDPGFDELLGRVRETMLEAYGHQHLPFEKLVEELDPRRDLSRSPLFQVVFVLQGAPLKAPDLPELAATLEPVENGTAKFDLVLALVEDDGCLEGYLEYDRDLFDATTIDRWSTHFRTLLEAVVAEPRAHLSELPLATRAQTWQLLGEWADNPVWPGAVIQGDPAALRRRPADGRAVHLHFFEHAARAPDRLAVVGPGVRWTYGELAARAVALAARLRSLGIGAEGRVALLLERSPHQVTAILGVLAAGAAYVPMETAHPADRIGYLMEDAAIDAVVVDDRSPADAVPATIPALRLDEIPAAAWDPAAGGWQQAGGERLAYIIYTSGSSGRPKGVGVTHRNLQWLLEAGEAMFDFGPDDVWTLFHSYAFDFSVWELWGALAWGGRLVVVPRAVSAAPLEFSRLLVDEGVTVLNQTPSAFHALAEVWQPEAEGPSALRWVIFGGEALDSRTLTAGSFPWGERGPHLVNMYGITETTVHVTWRLVVPRDRSAAASVPVGEALPGVRLGIFDRRLRTQPLGVGGEIGVTGGGVSRGYLGRPALTAQRFVPDPWPEVPGGRLYRSGDLARRRADGEIETLGRIDFQVKIRGHRVELGEIAAVLDRHPAILRSEIVLLDHQGDQLLVACVAPDGSPPAVEELKEWSREALPEVMRPAAVLVVDAFPLTVNGKLDRRALDRYARERVAGALREAAGAYAEPRTAAERELAAIWAEVLGVDRVGVDHDFFDLGGHSLLATRLIAKVRKELDVEVGLQDLFETPTVAGLAEVVTRARGRRAETGETAVPRLVPDPEGRHRPFPLTDVQQAYWVGRRSDLGLGGVAAHVYLELEGEGLDLQRLEEVWNRLIERHDMLRAMVEDDGLQRVLEEVPRYRFEVAELADLAPEEVEARLAAVRERLSHQVLPSDRWPLFEIRASALPGGRLRLHVSLDVLLFDGWSFQLLRAELERLYADPSAALEPLEITFRDYVLAETAFRDSEAYGRALEYWRERFDTLPAAPELPLATDPAGLSQHRFERFSGELDEARWRRLEGRAQDQGLTASAVLLTVFAEVLRRWSKSDRFTLNLTLFQRLPFHPQVDRLLGDFTSLTLLEVDGRETCAFAERVRGLQGQLWRDLDHRYVSGVRVLRELAARRGSAGVEMPVVFTSTLNLDPDGAAAADDPPPMPAELVYAIGQTPQVWLDHQVTTRGGVLHFNWDAVAGLFPPGLVADMFDAYRRLLDRLATSAAAWDAPVLDLLPAEQQEVLAHRNATEAPVPGGLLHQPIAARVAEDGDRPAVIAADRVLTYAELDRLADRYARRLRRRGARRNALVAVSMEKGWEQAVAVLAVLRAGAAYLPLAPDLPAERWLHLLERGEASLALTQERLLASLPWPAGVEPLAVIAGDEAGGGDEESAALEPVQEPGDLAYVIFTSGSTGLPKGVMIDHRGALNTVLDVDRRFAVGPSDRVLALSSLSFDLSVWDLFGVLGAGGTVVMPEPWADRDPSQWLELMVREGVTVWNSVPALLEMLVEYVEGRGAELPASLRLVLLSGDWIPVSLPDRVRASRPGLRLVSLGGATEASIWSILHEIDAVEPEWSSIPYGRPMVNQTFHVLGPDLEPRPVAVPGELFIGGVGVALGYWHDEERTAAAFFCHPRTGERLYRTGDLGRNLEDGVIEFLGREDGQVKIQGHRIELGEIEATLVQHPGVSAAAVAAAGDRHHRRLVAYVVEDAGSDRAARALEAAGVGPGLADLERPFAALEHKLDQPGLRRDLAEVGSATIDLPGAWPARRRPGGSHERRSRRRFAPEAVPLEALGQLLGQLTQVLPPGEALPRYRYGSAGSLYPVRVYLWIHPGAVHGLEAGAYYHDPVDHRLVLLTPASEVDEADHPAGPPGIEGVAFDLYLVAHLNAIEPVYGPRGRHYAVIEAGLMTQLLESSAASARLGLCQIGEVDFAAVGAACRLPPGAELVHSLVGGLPASAAESAAGSGAAATAGTLMAELERYLESRLPRAMVPRAWVRLEALPLTANGKVDRTALARDVRPTESKSGTGVAVPARGRVEEEVAEIFREILGIDEIGVTDSFFELGGSSVHLVQAHARLRQQTGVDLRLIEMFNHPTVRSLAALLDERREAPESAAEGAPESSGTASGHAEAQGPDDDRRAFRDRRRARRDQRLGPDGEED